MRCHAKNASPNLAGEGRASSVEWRQPTREDAGSVAGREGGALRRRPSCALETCCGTTTLVTAPRGSKSWRSSSRFHEAGSPVQYNSIPAPSSARPPPGGSAWPLPDAGGVLSGPASTCLPNADCASEAPRPPPPTPRCRLCATASAGYFFLQTMAEVTPAVGQASWSRMGHRFVCVGRKISPSVPAADVPRRCRPAHTRTPAPAACPCCSARPNSALCIAAARGLHHVRGSWLGSWDSWIRGFASPGGEVSRGGRSGAPF